MADRTVSVQLRAEASQFKSEMSSASSAVSGLASSGKKVGSETAAGMQTAGAATGTFRSRVKTLGTDMAASARQNSAAWESVGRTALVAGGVMTAVGGYVAKVGIEYNGLRQIATAGMTAITGSTKLAGEQMQRLDTYGQDSWLMRDSLVRAQQQMTGFGIETEKVIPYMDALSEATAATGGTSQDFEELARVMAKVKSEGKVTAQTLNEFGNRGVDAAQLIGDAMGKTAGEIRDEITAGTLDADAALDALAVGMQQKYQGASDLVRNTWRGATDDVKAAFRDMAAIMTSGLVDPEGGGALVTMMNKIADSIRAVNGLPDPFLKFVGGTGAALAGATLLLGGVLTLTPKLIGLADNLKLLGPIGQAAHTGLSKIGPTLGHIAGLAGLIGVTAVATGALFSAIKDDGQVASSSAIAASMEKLGIQGRNLKDLGMDQIFERLPNLFGQSTIGADDLGEALDQMIDPSVTDRVSLFAGEFLHLPSYMVDTKDGIAEVDDSLAEMVNAGHADDVAKTLSDMGYTAEEIAEQFPNTASAMEIVGLSAEQIADGMTSSNQALTEFKDNMKELTGALYGPAAAFDESITSLAEYSDSLKTTGISQDQFAADVIAASATMPPAIRDHLLEMGEEGVAIFAMYNDATLAEQQEWIADMEAQMGGGMELIAHAMAEGGDWISHALQGKGKEAGDELMAEVMAAVRAGEMDLRGAIEALELDVEVDAITDLAEGAINTFFGWAMDKPLDLDLFVDDENAKNEVTAIADYVGEKNPTLNLLGDAAEARGEVGFFEEWLSGFGLGSKILIPGDTEPAKNEVNAFGNYVSEKVPPKVKVGANTDSGKQSVTAFGGEIRGTKRDMKLGANPKQGQAALGALASKVADTKRKMKMGGDTKTGRNDLSSLSNKVHGTRRKMHMGGNTATGNKARITLANRVQQTKRKMQVGANTSPARRTVNLFQAPNKSIRFFANMSSVYSAVRNYQPSIRAQINPYMRNLATGGPVGLASGGPVRGPGSETSDSVPAVTAAGTPYRLSQGEHVWTAAETRGVGGHGAMQELRGEVRRSMMGLGGEQQLAAPQRSLTVNVVNHYPQAEPTSVTTNRAQQYAAAIGEA